MFIRIVFFILSTLLVVSAPSGMDRGFMLLCLVMVFSSIYAHIYLEKHSSVNNLSKVYLRHSVFFIICFFIVFFQTALDYILGFEINDRIIYDAKVVCKSLAISNLALNSLFIGYGLKRTREKVVIKKMSLHRNLKLSYFYPYKQYICYLGFLMLFVYLLTVDAAYLNNGYGKGMEVGENHVILVLLQAVIIASLSLYCVEYRGKNFRINDFFKKFSLPLLLILAYITIILITGRRGGAIRMAVLIMLSYICVVAKNVNYKRLLLAFVAAGLVFALVGVIRSMNSGEGATATEGIKELSNNASISPLTSELAASVGTLHLAVSNFPDVYPYNWGISFFPAILVLIPGAQRLYSSLFWGGEQPPMSAEILTNIYFSDNPLWGVGSSCVADTYISFGILGTVFIFILFGWFLRYLEYVTFCDEKSPYLIALSFCCYSQFLVICRGSIPSMFLSFSYAALLIFFFTLFFSKKAKKA